MPIKGIARKGDREEFHCSTPYRDGHFRSVFANGIPVSGHGHKNTRHLYWCGCPPCCCFHDETLKATQWAVFAEGIPVGRVGDPTCTRVLQGSPNVFVGGGVSGGRSGFNTFLDVLTVAGNVASVIPKQSSSGPLKPRGPGSAV